MVRNSANLCPPWWRRVTRYGCSITWATAKPTSRSAKQTPQKPEDDTRSEALEFLVDTVGDLINERGSDEKLWGSMVKQTMQRRRPGFNESFYGYRSFMEFSAQRIPGFIAPRPPTRIAPRSKQDLRHHLPTP